jgi:hypothetical protein
MNPNSELCRRLFSLAPAIAPAAWRAAQGVYALYPVQPDAAAWEQEVLTLAWELPGHLLELHVLGGFPPLLSWYYYGPGGTFHLETGAGPVPRRVRSAVRRMILATALGVDECDTASTP